MPEIVDQLRQQAAIDAFTAAAMGVGGWDHALHELADLTGSARGQLIGLGAQGATPFNWVTDIDERALAEVAAIDGHNPQVNARIAAALETAVLETVDERNYDALRPRLRRSAYEDFIDAYDIPHGCQTTLIRQETMMIGVGVLRTRRDGRTTPAQRAAFASLAPHIRTAVRTQMLFEGQVAPLLSGSLEAVGLPAFVCGADLRVQAMTPTAEQLLIETSLLTLHEGRLGSPDRSRAAMLEQAMRRCAAPPDGPPPAATVVLRDPACVGLPLVVDVLPLPRPRGRWSLSLDARLIVVPRRPRRTGATAGVLTAGYRLTPAEAAVALALAEGRPREEVAALRGVSVDTVRSQLKAIFQKMNVSREVDLVARVNALG